MGVAFQIVGLKNSGKTAVLLRMIAAAKKIGLTVAAVKDTHHAIMPDEPGTDSYRLYEAGADQIVLRHKAGIFLQKKEPAPESLEEILKEYSSSQADLILVEGFKYAGYPKLLMVKDLAECRLADELTNVEGVATLDSSLAQAGILDFSKENAAESWLIDWYQSYLIAGRRI